MNQRALIVATVIGTAAQMAMVLAGHFIPAVANLFPIVGILISLVAGLLYARAALGGWSDSLLGGAVAGGLCALIGIAMSWAMGDVEMMVLALGTASSAVGGVIGGALGKGLAK